MKMTICSQSSLLLTHTHKRKYVVAFQEIEEMQIKLAAVAAVYTQIYRHTIPNIDAKQFATKIGV